MGGTPKTALHRFTSILVHCSLFPVPCSRQLPRSLVVFGVMVKGCSLVLGGVAESRNE
ncbi:hypothetical protein [Moorena producens]|uniref:hypothetical protein n=1 Tax=Moorena producens TaxID=1155739 RepID=UPI003C77DF41